MHQGRRAKQQTYCSAIQNENTAAVRRHCRNDVCILLWAIVNSSKVKNLARHSVTLIAPRPPSCLEGINLPRVGRNKISHMCFLVLKLQRGGTILGFVGIFAPTSLDLFFGSSLEALPPQDTWPDSRGAVMTLWVAEAQGVLKAVIRDWVYVSSREGKPVNKPSTPCRFFVHQKMKES